MPFNWTLNPYRGCTHGCHYCFARRYHVQFEMNADDEFASMILVKRNFVEVLQRELDRPSWTREHVAFGTATDPYQPIEGHYRLTRRSIEALARGRTPIGLITKGPMVVRDRDVLLELTRAAGCTVYMSVPTVDEDAWRTLEPGTAHPLQRLRAVRELVDARRQRRRADGAHRSGLLLVAFEARTHHQGDRRSRRPVRRLQRHVPAGRHAHALHEVHRARFPVDDARGSRGCMRRNIRRTAYRNEIKAMVRVLQQRYGLTPREEAGGGGASRPDSDPAPRPNPNRSGSRW